MNFMRCSPGGPRVRGADSNRPVPRGTSFGWVQTTDSSGRPGPPSLPASTDDGVQPQESKPKEATTPNLAELDPDLLLTVMGDRPDEASLLPVRQRRLTGLRYSGGFSLSI
jgi:hypothetical protein